MEIGDITPEKGMICSIDGDIPVMITTIYKNKLTVVVKKLVIAVVKRSNDKPNGTIVYEGGSYHHELKYKDIKSSSDYEIIEHTNPENPKEHYEFAICKDVTYGKRKLFKYRKWTGEVDTDLFNHRQYMKRIGTKCVYYRHGKILHLDECKFYPEYITDDYGNSEVYDCDLPTIYINDS